MLEGRKVLILESNAAVAFPLGSALRKAGWAVISAQDAAQAMQVARQQKPDAVVLNATLAGGGGIVALKRLRSSVLTTTIPAICIVGRDSRERADLEAAGAQELIEPPGDPVAIEGALARHLGRRNTMTYQVPPVVLGSPARNTALRKSGLLDSPEDERLDELTRLA
ncbi:MAG TPA: response regulator, partial [Thermoanaerobaculia bacterium]|nr:response regulator [Thermoanaerobaculia bacterium]